MKLSVGEIFFPLFLCFLGGFVMGIAIEKPVERRAEYAIAECEQDLPGDQHFELTAVPEE